MARSAVVDRSSQNETVSRNVVTAVAEETGRDPKSLEPLYDAIDPDALDALYRTDGLGTRRTPVRLEFRYAGCDVVVSGDGSVSASASPRTD